MSKAIKERFVIVRQLDLDGRRWLDNTTYSAAKGLPGRVLERVKDTVLEAWIKTEGEDGPELDDLVKQIVNSLYEPVEFDFDGAMADDETWQRGMFRP